MNSHADLLGDPKRGGGKDKVGLVSTRRVGSFRGKARPQKLLQERNALDGLDKVRVKTVAELGDSSRDLVEPVDRGQKGWGMRQARCCEVG